MSFSDMNIFLDIETIPGQAPGLRESFIAEAQANFKAPSGLTKEKAAADLGITDTFEFKATSKDEMIARWEKYFAGTKAVEVGEENWRKTSFDGAHGQICVISAAIDDAEPVTFYRGYWANEEGDLLREFFAFVTNSYNSSCRTHPVFVGHNLLAFDLRFIFQRAVMLQIKPPACIPFNARPWDATVFDTMIQWAGVGNRVSLDKLCKVFGIDGKGSEIGEEMDGSKVWDMVGSGRIADVAKYCAGDVERTRAIYKMLTFQE